MICVEPDRYQARALPGEDTAETSTTAFNLPMSAACPLGDAEPVPPGQEASAHIHHSLGQESAGFPAASPLRPCQPFQAALAVEVFPYIDLMLIKTY